MAHAEHARAAAKVGLLVLLEHLGQPARCQDPARVDQAVQKPRLDLETCANLLRELVLEVVRDQVERLRIVLDLGIQACKIEPVQDVVVVDFAEVLIATR